MAGSYSVKETTKSQQSGTSLNENGLIIHTMSRTFSIVLDDGTSDDTVSVQRATEGAGTLPAVGSLHPSYPALACQTVDVTRESVIWYNATATYESQPRQSQDDENAPPTSLPAVISFSTVHSQREIETSSQGNPIQTKAGEPYTLSIKQSDLAIQIEKNVPSFNPYSVFAYNNKVNSDSFLGFPPGTAIIDDIAANLALEAGVAFWKLSVRVLVREPAPGMETRQAWWQKVLHEGYYCLELDANNKVVKVHCTEYTWDNANQQFVSTGERCTTPQLLNEDGTQIISPDDQGGDDDEGSAPEVDYRKWQVYGSISFNALGLL